MNRPRHVPLRRCVACRTSAPKRDLVRLVRTDDRWALDLRQRAGGRGTSLCPACALAGVRRDDPARLKAFRRAFRQDADAVTALLRELEGALAATIADASPAAAAAESRPEGLVPGRPSTESPRPNGGMHD